MKIPFKWEEIYVISGLSAYRATLRAKVIGGWIVKEVFFDNVHRHECMQFVPDPTHEWEIDRT